MQKHEIYKILKEYNSGKLNKYEAMELLDVEEIGELFSLLAEYKIPPVMEAAYFQSDASQPPLESYFSDE